VVASAAASRPGFGFVVVLVVEVLVDVDVDVLVEVDVLDDVVVDGWVVEVLDEVLDRAKSAVEVVLTKGVSAAMNEFNRTVVSE